MVSYLLVKKGFAESFTIYLSKNGLWPSSGALIYKLEFDVQTKKYQKTLD